MWLITVLVLWLGVGWFAYHGVFKDLEVERDDRAWACGLALMWPIWLLGVIFAGAYWLILLVTTPFRR